MLKHFALAITILFPLSVQATLNIPALHSPAINTLTIQDPSLAKAGLTENTEDLTSDQNLSQVHLNEKQLHEAKVWELTIDEEKRYVLLMQNRSKIYYQRLRLTPLDILGINARNEAERNHFAELAATQEAQKVSKNIAWNNAFYKAYNKLFANVPVVGDFDPSPYSPYAHNPIQLNQGDILYLFVKPGDAVKTLLMMLIEAIENTHETALHLMVLESEDVSIQLWANKHQIPLTLVNSGRITLNHGDLNYQSLKSNKKASPLLVLSKNGSSNLVDLGRF